MPITHPPHRRRTSRLVPAVLAVFLLANPGTSPGAALAQAGQVTGVVVDTSGAPVPAAIVELSVNGAQVATVETGDDGRFTVAAVPDGELLVTATAIGFAVSSQLLVGAAPGPVRLVLHPEILTERVTVTASRQRDRLDTPASTTVISSAELLNSGAGAIDDALLSTPGFSLFRRSSSRIANPTTQGVTLRGISGSGSSRTIVLADGWSLNDPFGNWVYWNRVPEAAIDRVEIVRGATGDLYGADAMGGVIQMLTFEPRRARLRGTLEFGEHATTRGSLFAGGQRNGWNATAAGEVLRTDGVVLVVPEERGDVDVEAGSDYESGYVTFGYDADVWRLQGRAGVYGEDRDNGTPAQINSTNWRSFGLEASGTAGNGVWQARGAGGTEEYYQTFSAVLAGRNDERLVRGQRTPSSFSSFDGQWVQALGAHSLLVGAESGWIDSTLNETAYSFGTGLPVGFDVFGGEEITAAGYGRLRLNPRNDVTLVLGARGDYWKTTPLDRASPTHSVGFFSPRASVAWQATPEVSVHGSVYRAHRAPTLNELYRGFQVGQIVTNPNPLLEPESLTGFEGGVLLSRSRLSARVTGFVNFLDDSIANITIGDNLRERQNAGKIRAAGVEIEADIRPHRFVTLTGMAVFTGSYFGESVTQNDLDGNRVPQVPLYQLGAGLTYANPALLTASAQLRILGAQWDDDLNQDELDGYAVMDAFFNRSLTRGLNVFVAIENLFDAEYAFQLFPTRTGWPRTVRGGVRMFLP